MIESDSKTNILGGFIYLLSSASVSDVMNGAETRA